MQSHPHTHKSLMILHRLSWGCWSPAFTEHLPSTRRLPAVSYTVGLSIARLCLDSSSGLVSVWKIIIPFSGRRAAKSLWEVTWQSRRGSDIHVALEELLKVLWEQRTQLLLSSPRYLVGICPSCPIRSSSLETMWMCSIGINFSTSKILCSGKLELCSWTRGITDVFGNHKGIHRELVLWCPPFLTYLQTLLLSFASSKI